MIAFWTDLSSTCQLWENARKTKFSILDQSYVCILISSEYSGVVLGNEDPTSFSFYYYETDISFG